MVAIYTNYSYFNPAPSPPDYLYYYDPFYSPYSYNNQFATQPISQVYYDNNTSMPVSSAAPANQNSNNNANMFKSISMSTICWILTVILVGIIIFALLAHNYNRPQVQSIP